MVSTYLVHHGYCATAEAFSRSTDQTFHEDLTSIKNRQRILKLVLAGRMGEAIETTDRLYPGLLDRNQNLLFQLKCRQFVEMVNGSDSEVVVARTRGQDLYSPALSNSSPKQRSVSPETVIQSTRAVNGSNKNRSRRSSVEELNQTNAINGSNMKISDPVIIEENDVDMDGEERKSNGVQNGSSHDHDHEVEEMGMFPFLGINSH